MNEMLESCSHSYFDDLGDSAIENARLPSPRKGKEENPRLLQRLPAQHVVSAEVKHRTKGCFAHWAVEKTGTPIVRTTASLASLASLESLECLAGQCGKSDLDSLWGWDWVEQRPEAMPSVGKANAIVSVSRWKGTLGRALQELCFQRSWPPYLIYKHPSEQAANTEP